MMKRLETSQRLCLVRARFCHQFAATFFSRLFFCYLIAAIGDSFVVGLFQLSLSLSLSDVRALAAFFNERNCYDILAFIVNGWRFKNLRLT